MKTCKKVLILGSGALKIGEAGEFDYSGSQAIKALKEEGIQTVLINPNIATIQTDFLADKKYFLPVREYFVEEVIKKEKPDGILISFGGQTALNCGMGLHKKGILKTYGVKILGTSIESVIIAEDREKFANHLRNINIPTPTSRAAETIEQAKKIAQSIGYPVMIRAGFALGGLSSGIAHTQKELEKIAFEAFSFSPQILVEQYLHHYKEVEYEIVRDIHDNCVAVCNMENFDPLGIHTGESIVVAPSQTLTNYEYHFLRKKAIEIVRSLNIVGECNVQFALNPKPKNNELEYHVIELNPRLSRSSALASKATGYPLAYVAAKLALGKSLISIQNKITKVTQSFFEPALDYIVVKIPRWDLGKFKGVTEKIGTSMKSVGEIMAIGRTFEEAVQKAVRMLSIGVQGITDNGFFRTEEEVVHYVKTPTPKRIFALAEALRRNMSVEKLYEWTGIDPWFLHRIKAVVEKEETFIKHKNLNYETLLQLKQFGFSDKKLARLTGKIWQDIRKKRKELGIIPSFFQIDTLAGEFPVQTNYLYATYNGSHHDIEPLGNKGVMVLGSGPYRIGSSVEFDWTCVNTALSLKRYKKQSIIVNCNPETVSTDYDISDRLYFEELSLERILDVYEFENSQGIILSVGGQTPNNHAKAIAEYGARILGTSAENIDRAEDRNKFSRLLDKLGILQPSWNMFTTEKEACDFAKRVGYPVLIRPSYVLSGDAMHVCYTVEELLVYMQKATEVSKKHPITVSKFFEEAKEIELDAVAQDGVLQVYVVSEHVENAGVHSGDATIVYPAQKIYLRTEQTILEIARKLAKELHITGPFNIQFMAKENKVYVIETNLRASRTFPFISKATKINFAHILVDSLFGKSKQIDIPYPNYAVVKVAQFSFGRLQGADPVLRVEMSSTGEVACFGRDIEEAFLKGRLSVGGRIPKKGIFLSLGGEEHKVRFLSSALRLRTFGVPLYATEKTAQFLKSNGIKAKRLYKIHENKTPNILTEFQKGNIDLAINIADYHYKKDIDDDFIIRRFAVDHNISLSTNRQKSDLFVKAITEKKLEDLEVKEWGEY